MRVLLDTNIFISYLLAPQRRSGPTIIVEAAAAEEFVILVPQQLLEEIRRKTTTGRLAQRIASGDLMDLMVVLQEVGEIPPVLSEIERYTRDVKDDYLIAYALAGGIDYLVTGDKDLLTLGNVGRVQIVTTGEFIAVLRGRTASE